MKFAHLFILILAFLIIRPAQAGLLLEPVAGYSLSKFETDTAGSGEEKANGTSLGGRVGYQNLGFQLGLDYLRSNLSVDDNDYKEDYVTNEFAAFVGFEFPILLRVYAGYIFAATGETQKDFGGVIGKQDIEVSDGTGLKLGVGFTVLPFLDINVEYRKGSFGEIKIGSTKDDVDTDFSAVMVGVSLPFVI
jgi:opacity protein-like surface antigen